MSKPESFIGSIYDDSDEQKDKNQGEPVTVPDRNEELIKQLKDENFKLKESTIRYKDILEKQKLTIRKYEDESKEADRIKGQLIDLEKSEEDLKKKYSWTMEQLGETQEKLVKANSEVITLQNLTKSLKQKSTSVDITLEENQNLKQEIDDIKSKNQSLVSENLLLKSNLEEIKEQLARTVDNLNGDIKELKKKQENARNKLHIVTKTGQINEQARMKEAKEMMHRIDELNQEITQLNKKLEQKDQIDNELKKNREQVFEELNITSETVESLKQSLESTKKKHQEQIQKINADHKNTIKKLNEKLQKVLKETSDSQSQKISMTKIMSSQQQKCKKLQQNNMDLISEIQQLKNEKEQVTIKLENVEKKKVELEGILKLQGRNQVLDDDSPFSGSHISDDKSEVSQTIQQLPVQQQQQQKESPTQPIKQITIQPSKPATKTLSLEKISNIVRFYFSHLKNRQSKYHVFCHIRRQMEEALV